MAATCFQSSISQKCAKDEWHRTNKDMTLPTGSAKRPQEWGWSAAPNKQKQQKQIRWSILSCLSAQQRSWCPALNTAHHIWAGMSGWDRFVQHDGEHGCATNTKQLFLFVNAGCRRAHGQTRLPKAESLKTNQGAGTAPSLQPPHKLSVYCLGFQISSSMLHIENKWIAF